MAVVVAIVRTTWTGTSGGPGLTQLAMEGIADPHSWDPTTAQAAVNAVRAFWDGCKAWLPDDIVLTVQPIVDIYNIQTAELVGSHSAATPPANVLGTSATSFAMASGLKANLNTSTIRNGRRVRGSIFLVPAASAAFTNDGLSQSTARTSINTAGSTLMGALVTSGAQLVVWSRPQDTPTPRDGATAPVTSIEVSTKGAILRGRRD